MIVAGCDANLKLEASSFCKLDFEFYQNSLLTHRNSTQARQEFENKQKKNIAKSNESQLWLDIDLIERRQKKKNFAKSACESQ